jgi:hypothetical protein
MKIVDCFPYFNEKELLELRIKLLYDKVDKFIICDGNYTQSGIPKEYSCKKTLTELGIFNDKIIVVEVNMPSLQEEKNCWVRERLQRNAAESFIDDGDVCFVGDCDEIINPKHIDYYVSTAKQHPNNILRVPLVYLIGRADLRVYDEFNNPRKWNTSFMCLSEHLKTCTLSEIRESHSMQKFNIPFSDIFITNNGKVEDAGWHFSWMGNSEILKEKSKSSMHVQDYVSDSVAQFGTEEMMEFLNQYIPEENSTDPLGRKNHILKKYSLNNLPSILFELPRVKNYLLPEHKINHIYQNPEFGEDWFSYPQLYSSMVNQFPSGSKFVEVGSWKGKSSAFMAVEIANSQKDIEFICIDTWEGSVEHQNFKELKNLHDIFKSNMKPLEKYYRSIKSKSLDAVNSFPDQSLDFVFIDASHEYEDVKNDIIAWFPKVKVGGVLAGHDYYENNDFAPGVKMAVNEIFRDFETSENCFIVRKEMNRTDTIQLSIDKINAKSYLEIEVSEGENFQINNNINEIPAINHKTLLSILEENPFLKTDKNTICYKKYPEQWEWFQYHSYIDNFYETSFKKYQNKKNLNLLEIGIDVGGSIALWSKYFHDCNIIGVDISTDRLSPEYQEKNFSNVKYFIENAYNETFIDTLPSFDIIIDDGPHTFSSMLFFIEKYLPKLNKNGIMVIEDIPNIEWIKYFKLLVPTIYKTKIFDLRKTDNRYDSIIFSIEK